MGRARQVLSLLGLACCVLLLAGCGGSQSNSEPLEKSNLRPLANLYGIFMARHGGKAPADEQEFKKYVLALKPDQLQAYGVKQKPEELFISPRDNEPYVILYGEAAKKGPPGPASMPVIAYEKTGVGGVRFVASSYGAVEPADAARFKQLVPNGP